ncbi:MAG TPA: hypothetical protein VFM05_02800 [Candidatus Saccharimonadales bacterium]|nr:hypothetical protein [Candidatus Saccharimonadales bacterium]
MRLPLDDPRWASLMTRNGRAAYVPDELRALLARPSNGRRFSSLWPALCSEDTAWPAAYAALPYVLEIARALKPAERVEHLYFIGYVSMCEESGEVPDYLADTYRETLHESLPLLAETLVSATLNEEETRYLLAAFAALKGHRDLGQVIDCLDSGCPHCGEGLLGEG